MCRATGLAGDTPDVPGEDEYPPELHAAYAPTLEDQVVMAVEALREHGNIIISQGSDLRALFERTDRLAQGLAHLAVALVDLRDRKSRWARFTAWLRG